MTVADFVRSSVLPGGLAQGESVLTLGAAEEFSYTIRRLMGGLQSAYNNVDATRPVSRLVVVTSARLLELDVESRGGFARVTAMRELRFASCADVITGEAGQQRGFDVGSPGARTFAFRYSTVERPDLVDAATQADFFQRAAGLVDEGVRAARARGPAEGSPALTSVLPAPIEQPGFAQAVAAQAQQSEASRVPVFLARGVAAVFGVIGLFFMVIKLDHIGDGSFFRAFCIGTFSMGLAVAAGVWSVVRDARAARARG